MEVQLEKLLNRPLQSLRIKLLESYEGELTDDEIIDMVIDACENKRAKQRLAEYREKLANTQKPEPITSENLYSIIIGRAIEYHESRKIKFALTDEEKHIYWLLSMYFTSNPEFEKLGFNLNKGLLLFGVVGCGKTTLMQLFRINPRSNYGLYPCAKISEFFKKEGVEGIEKFYQMDSICFDDLGTETGAKHFGNESNVMADMILTRYENEVTTGFKTHITTNLTTDEIETYYGKRVRSRMKEMFNVIDFPETATDKRK